MSESNNESPKTKTSFAKRTFIGLLFFAIICMSITYACIYMTLENRKQTNDIQKNQETYENKVEKSTSKHKTLKLTDKAYLNGITETREKENYGEVVDYYEYDDTYEYKLKVEYLQIQGLKDRNIQATINQAIKDKVDEIKEEYMSHLDDSSIDRIWIEASVCGNFSDVISIKIEDYIYYKEDHNNYYFDSHVHSLNFSLATGEQLKFKDLFWEDSPVKTILSQSIYKSLAKTYAFEQEDWEWDWNMDNLDYSKIESEVYNFMYQYNKNPDIEFYFSPSQIQIPYNKNTIFLIDMANFYEYIAIYTKYKANTNLYEDNTHLKEFYVFANYVSNEGDYVKESGKKADNIFYRIYCYDILEDMNEEKENSYKAAYRAIIKKVNDYSKELKKDEDYGYIIEGFYMQNDYDNKYGYNFQIEIARCDRKYFDEHLEDALAAGARAPKVDIAPTNYGYIDEDNFEFYENYTELMDDYTDETTLQSSTYTKSDRDRDIEE